MFASDQPILADIYFENVDILMIYIFLLVLIFWGVFNFVTKYINFHFKDRNMTYVDNMYSRKNDISI